jgi:hypothetical protein
MRIVRIAALALVAGVLCPTYVHPQSPPRVAIAPVEVAFDKGWLADMNRGRSRSHAVAEEDARRIATDLAADLHKALGDAVRARGFEVVGPGAVAALRLSARIDDLYVTAPDLPSPGITRTYVREAGRATLRVEGRDDGGVVRLQAERHGTAGDHMRLERASNVTNRYWFDALFRSWAGEVAAELGKSQAR